MSGAAAELLGSLAQMLGMAQGAAGGALSALLAQLENAGLSEHVRSWIGQGESLPVTAEQLAAVFTPEQLNEWAEQAGTTPDAVLQVLAEKLPGAAAQAAPRPLG